MIHYARPEKPSPALRTTADFQAKRLQVTCSICGTTVPMTTPNQTETCGAEPCKRELRLQWYRKRREAAKRRRKT